MSNENASSALIILTTQKLQDTRQRILFFALLFFMATLIFATLHFTAGDFDFYLLYGAISITYLGLYFFWHKGTLITIIFASLFYIAHTSYELLSDIDLSFLTSVGLKENTMDNPRSLFLIFFDIIRVMYPYVRVALAITFPLGIISWFKLRKYRRAAGLDSK